MIQIIATDIANKIELITEGNHAYYTRPTTGANRNRYRQFAGRTLDAAVKSLNARAMIGY